MKKLASLFILLIFVNGCSNSVKYSASNQWAYYRPYRIAVAPVIFKDKDDSEIAAYFARAASEKLAALGYTVVSGQDRPFSPDSPGETAKGLQADSVLVIRIDELKKSVFATYASFRIKARFDLYTASNIELWKAEYGTKESDLRLDRKPLEYSVIKTYEPRVQRYLDSVFSTLPRVEATKKTQSFFQWLP